MAAPARLGSGGRYAALKAKTAAAKGDAADQPDGPPKGRKKLPPGAMQAMARGRKPAPPAK